MKIYFIAAIHWREKYGASYERIVKHLRQAGHKVYADHILSGDRDEIRSESANERNEYYKNTLKIIKKSDLVVAEVSTPSTINVGHEISLAIEMGTPVLGFYKTGQDPIMVKYIPSKKFLALEYTDDSLEEMVEYGMSEIESTMESRFTMIVPGEIQKYLDSIAKSGITF